MTFDEAIGHAARLLLNAELEDGLPRMQRMEGLADSWLTLARLLAEKERD
ncbi:hypothetical protein ABZ815_20245 [Nonomuraea sp. NPDC047529]